MSMTLERNVQGTVSAARPRMGRGVPVAALSLVLAALWGCSETSLDQAPVVDLSSQAGARGIKPPPMAIPASPGEVLYTVKKGDTLFHLASTANSTMQDLARWNGIDVHAPIFVGQQLRLQPPVGSGETAAEGAGAAPPAAEVDSGPAAEPVATPIPLSGAGSVETRALDAAPGAAAVPGGGTAPLPASGAGASAAPVMPAVAAAQPGAPAGSAGMPATPPAPPPVAGAAAAAAPAPVNTPGAGASAATIGWIWPVEGPVTGKFDTRGKGIEIAAAQDAPVLAVADGTVTYLGSPRDYGNLVILKHSDELLSVYAHNKTLLVKEGQTVRRGQTIATAGGTPGVPATLHFEVRRNHVAIDPLDVLPLR